MSAVENINADAFSDAQQSFAIETLGADELSVSGNDAGELIVSCESHDGAATIAMEPVFALAGRHDLSIIGGAAHWDDEAVELVVVDGDWQRGEESDTDG